MNNIIPDKWASYASRPMDTCNPDRTIWNDGVMFRIMKSNNPSFRNILKSALSLLTLAKVSSFITAIQAFISAIKTQPGPPIFSAKIGLCGFQRDTILTLFQGFNSLIQGFQNISCPFLICAPSGKLRGYHFTREKKKGSKRVITGLPKCHHRVKR